MNQQSSHEPRIQPTPLRPVRTREAQEHRWGPWHRPAGHSAEQTNAILDLLGALGAELEGYMKWSKSHPMEPRSEQVATEKALEWMRTSLEDISATLTGITLSRGETP